MRLSILDQAPISSNQTAAEALNESMKLAQAGETLGYTRFWVAEHHDLPGLACSAPEVMLGYIGANTNKIRIGAGAVLLPHYKPYKVAEVYNMLAALFPDRVDLGIGRAPGGSAEATNALSDNFLQQVWNMPNSVKDLLHFLDNNVPPEHQHAKVTAAPVPALPPMPWLLGTSKKSAILAAENGLAYAFGQFMSDQDGAAIIDLYKNHFKPRKQNDVPQVIVTVTAICAETSEKADDVALSSLVWGLQRKRGEGKMGVPSIQEAKEYLQKEDKDILSEMKDSMIIGNPQQVKKKLEELQEKFHANEIMIVTITHSPADKIQSYKLIAEEILHNTGG
ncbi:LLM class flavin-dependent oxidoreductase [Neobacillus sp. DY30]|uniref:LLM class flavin-dependent oxidoreductase n=1 Tax=Neobacillus sp. DY30 TaxID=3047871 RepID=UPI0024BF9D88|nr:LLM class flavin-dependent oxidoreductase [Neobacillus sp. DY30]WHX98290.1 LLM class flavin-dependent oxidoreductase [Neobacillus sp. DY30]